MPWPRWRLAVLLFLTTALTTTVVGARLQYNFDRALPAYSSNRDVFPFVWAWHHPGMLWLGLPFSMALMAILLAHELGHFLACRYYRLDSTYPLFLPAPTLIGTMGAFIRIRAPFHERRELFDIGAAGPLAGLALTVPLLLLGLAGSRVLTPQQAVQWRQQWVVFGWPPVARWAAALLYPGVSTTRLALAPVARAAWLGLLVTMLNLIPGAQLDGGHILYAVSPRLHAIASWSALGVLAWLGWRYWPGWFVFAGFIALMRVRHPFVPETQPLGRARTLLAVVALLILVLSFVPAPVIAL